MKFAVGELSPLTFRTACVLISGLGLMALAALSVSESRCPGRNGRRCWRWRF